MSVLPEIGIHHEEGGQWMLENRLRGWCLSTVTLGTRASFLDFSRFASAGIKMIVRLNYADTLPNPHDYFEIESFVEAAVHTMAVSEGIQGYIFGSQLNHAAEISHPKSITPEHYARVYNRVWEDKPEHVKLAPAEGELDNLTWWKKMLGYITDADFFAIHPQMQPNKHPFELLLDAIPQHLRPRPIHAARISPLRQDEVSNAVSELRGWNANPQHDLQIRSVIFEGFCDDQPELLDVIKKAIRKPVPTV